MHPDGESVVTSGETLGDIIRSHPDMLGTHVLQITMGRKELPILVKLIDAKSDLSVQVHPNDEYAKRVENSWGKTEMWYVLSARKDSEIIFGFNRDVDTNTVKDAINKGTIGKLLNHVPVKKNDVFFIESGTVHAIGAGCLIAEIQQNSNITYRFYDYDRVDKNGGKRPLHVDRALDVANLKSSTSPRQPMRVINYKRGYASELLSRCKYFQVERLLLNTEGRKMAGYQSGNNSFHTLLCVEGCGVMYGESVVIPFFKGDCIFVPADSLTLMLHGVAQLLDISC